MRIMGPFDYYLAPKPFKITMIDVTVQKIFVFYSLQERNETRNEPHGGLISFLHQSAPVSNLKSNCG